jgi:predicted GNAT family N-acyltransferase
VKDCLRKAVRAGQLYEAFGLREIAVILARHLTLDLLLLIQLFRGRIYESNGPIDAVKDGANVHPADEISDHILLLHDSELVACARYERRAGEVELGGFVVEPAFRGGRATQKIVLKVREHAIACGDSKFIARASVEFGSSSILQKFGARVISSYFEPAYQRHVDLVEIILPSDVGQKAA